MKNPALLEEIKTYKGRDEVPEDFDAFWDEEIKKVSSLPAYQLEERDFHIPQVNCYELTFEGTNEGKVYARVVLPKSEEKVPLIFHFHGYMGRGWDWADMLAFTVAGYGVVSMDVRGQSGYSQDGLRSPLGNTVKGHIIRGAVEGRDQLFYKDVYLDIYQLIEIVASLPQVDEERLSSYGASQGGALALVAAALNLGFSEQLPSILSCQTLDECLRLAIPVKPMMNSSDISSSMIPSMKQRRKSWQPLPISM